jgi:hypothetical protein
MDIHNSKAPIDFNKEIKRLNKLYQSRLYFEVIIKGVQLMEWIALWIEYSRTAAELENLEEFWEEKKYDIQVRIFNEYNKIAGEYRSKESSRLKFIEMLYHEFSVDEKNYINPSLFQKANRIFAFRNKIAHDYYTDSTIDKKLRIRAKNCIDILNLFLGNSYF